MTKILVVDNDRFMLKIMQTILSKESYEVKTAQSGLAAIDLLKDYTPDVMFIDLVMPNIDGRRLCRIVQGMPKLENTHLIILSAIAEEEEIDIEDLGVDAVIPKGPYNIMAEQILRVLDESLRMTPRIARKADLDAQGLYQRGVIQELMSVKKHFEIILERMSEGILEISSKGRILYANPSALLLISIPEERLLGTNFVDLFVGADRERAVETLKTIGASPQITDADPVDLNKNQVTVNILPIDDAEVTAIIILTDVSERKRAERILKKAKEYTDNIINTMADSLIVLKPDLTINLVNRVTCDLLGYAEKELIGEPIDVVFYEDVHFEGSLLEEIGKEGTIRYPTMGYKTKTGEKVPVSFSGSAMYEEGDADILLGIICIAHDMRKIEELQSQIRHAEKMAATGVLSAGVAHEIKNPLAIIIQGLESLRFSLSSVPENAVYMDMIGRIKNAAKRADTIVKGLLDFSRQTKASFDFVGVSDMIDEALSLVEPQTDSSNIEIVRNYAPGVKSIRADKNLMGQVFINLLMNAIEAMPDGGTIAVSTKISEDDERGTRLEVIFTDNGCGILPETTQNVFEPFFTTKTESLNTGLGLSVTRGIVEKHQGLISIQSGMNKGTSVIISLPYNDGS
jgi:PAS domain S-box-containing protein